MKNEKITFGRSVKDALYLFKIQLSLGWKGVLCQFLYIFMNAAKGIIPVLLPKLVIDACINGRITAFAWILTGASLLSWLVDATIGITEWLQSIFNLKFAHYFKRRICEKAMEADYRDIENPDFLDSIERAMDAAYYGLSQTLFADLAVTLLKLAFLFVTISVLNVWIALGALALVVGLYFINRKAAEVNHKFEMERSPHKRKAGYAEETMLDLRASKDIRLFGAQNMFFQKYRDASEAEIGIIRRQNRYNLLIALIRVLINGAAICGMYVYLIFRYDAGLVLISSFTMYIAAFSQLYGSVDDLFRVLIDFRESSINLRRVEELFDWAVTVGNGRGESFDEELRTVQFENVTFTYPGQDSPAIENLSLRLGADERVILVGENGAGKTTVVKLLLRLYDVDSGRILVNGKDIRTLNYRDYISHFAPVFQDVWLFAYSVRDNITFGRPTDEVRLSAALDFAGLNRVFDGGEATVDSFCGMDFDEAGINFSGGEQQKLCIARAVYRDADALIMDEPNSALDALSEKELSDNLRALSQEKMLLLISHRLSMSRFCNHIAVLENGRLVEEGDHSTLLEKNGSYAKLYLAQAEQYI